ncbi:MAG: type III pantothenate kinase [Opitutales bacterium]|nr:type III pantothenate kinase [Opitutales bacterium]
MVKLSTTISCIDIGNTICHLGIYKDGILINEHYLKTTKFIESPSNLVKHVPVRDKVIAFCSVVPKATSSLSKHANDNDFTLYNLNINSTGSFPISYPHPEQIGQDRIANAIAVYHTMDLPCVVIDVGTATTFDIVSESGGYEGGIITPGPQGFLDFLHQNTALLPKVLLDSKLPNNSIGRDTKEAMLIGVAKGYPSMVNGIVESIFSEIYNNYHIKPKMVITGGGRKNLSIKDTLEIPNLTIYGLAIAFQLNCKF